MTVSCLFAGVRLRLHGCSNISTTSVFGTPKKNDVKKPTTPVGRFDREMESSTQDNTIDSKNSTQTDAYSPFPDNKNPVTGEIGGPRGPEPTRYGDWERKGRVIDF